MAVIFDDLRRARDRRADMTLISGTPIDGTPIGGEPISGAPIFCSHLKGRHPARDIADEIRASQTRAELIGRAMNNSQEILALKKFAAKDLIFTTQTNNQSPLI